LLFAGLTVLIEGAAHCVFVLLLDLDHFIGERPHVIEAVFERCAVFQCAQEELPVAEFLLHANDDPRFGNWGIVNEALLDPAMILSSCGGDDSLLRKLCQSIQARLPGHLTALQDALEQQDAPRLCGAAHRLCGMIAAFSTVAGDLVSKIEDRAGRGEIEECRPLVGQLVAMAQRLTQSVNDRTLDRLRHEPCFPSAS
jgi:hypothetical protein